MPLRYTHTLFSSPLDYLPFVYFISYCTRKNIVMLCLYGCQETSTVNERWKTDSMEYNTRQSYARAIVVAIHKMWFTNTLFECVMDKIYLNDENGVPIRVKATTIPLMHQTYILTSKHILKQSERRDHTASRERWVAVTRHDTKNILWFRIIYSQLYILFLLFLLVVQLAFFPRFCLEILLFMCLCECWHCAVDYLIWIHGIGEHHHHHQALDEFRCALQ